MPRQFRAAAKLLTFLFPLIIAGSAFANDEPLPDFPQIELPPPIPALVGLPQRFPEGRARYLSLVTREAERLGLPADIADAVAYVESGYRPGVVGGVGEVGLMQIRPQTAAMLGHEGGLASLFDPEINVRYGVKYLAEAWRLANGNLCRALMKYRAGWGEERLSPLSQEYCRRARVHLANIGSPLAGATPAGLMDPAELARLRTAPLFPAQAGGLPASGSRVLSNVEVAWANALKRAQAQARSGRGTRTARDSQQFWAAHEAMIRLNTAKLRKRQVAHRRSE